MSDPDFFYAHVACRGDTLGIRVQPAEWEASDGTAATSTAAVCLSPA
ncbi:hypothetical protein ACIP39_28315 [Streptomyces tibetensis]